MKCILSQTKIPLIKYALWKDHSTYYLLDSHGETYTFEVVNPVIVIASKYFIDFFGNNFENVCRSFKLSHAEDLADCIVFIQILFRRRGDRFFFHKMNIHYYGIQIFMFYFYEIIINLRDCSSFFGDFSCS